MRFAKYHGTGNDFVLVEDLDDRIALAPDVVAAVCDRRRGVGADGLIRIAPADQADLFMDYHNADGAAAEMCGNGIRCLAAYAYDRGLVRGSGIEVLTRAGIKRVEVRDENGRAGEVTVDMGPPAFERKAIPMAGDPEETFIGQHLTVGSRTYPATAMSMGNPHCVLLLHEYDDLERVEVPRIGRTVEHRPNFPNRTNVEFVQVRDGRIVARVWERGSGETLACGTGACAALVACVLGELTAREADVAFPGGVLRVAWPEDGPVFLTGPAVHVYDGEVDPTWLQRHATAGR